MAMPSDTNSSQINNNQDIYPWLLLALTPHVGPVTMAKLMQHFGSATNVLEQNLVTLSQFVSNPIAKLIKDQVAKVNVDKALEWASQSDCSIITPYCELYPQALAEIAMPPPILYLHGNKNLLKKNKLAIVGSRHPTQQGISNAFRFAKDLAKNNLTIVSGMAQGVDKAAHLGALESPNSTIGVIATGINMIYPIANKEIYAKVIEQGLLISEFPINTPPSVANFPRRNRIIAGLSLGCLVIESTIDGSSLISANYALEMGREIMAIPGSIYNPQTRGCHKLIKQGAKLIETVNDVLEEISPVKTYPKNLNKQNSKEPILAAMGDEPIEIAAICYRLNLDFDEICAKLLELELNGLIVNCGLGKYQRIFK